MSTRFFREPRPVVKSGGLASVIQDNGDLKAAVADSSGDFLFTDAGAGVMPLVCIGAPDEILKYFISQKKHFIVNKIAELSDIYFGVDYFVPKNRFEGLSVLHDTFLALTKAGADFVPGSIVADIASIVNAAISTGKDISSGRHRNKINPNLMYAKVSYLPEDGLVKVAKHKLSMEVLTELAFEAFRRSGAIK